MNDLINSFASLPALKVKKACVKKLSELDDTRQKEVNDALDKILATKKLTICGWRVRTKKECIKIFNETQDITESVARYRYYTRKKDLTKILNLVEAKLLEGRDIFINISVQDFDKFENCYN